MGECSPMSVFTHFEISKFMCERYLHTLCPGGPQVRLKQGDVIDWRGDVPVNYGNETLSGSSGVSALQNRVLVYEVVKSNKKV